MKKYVLSLTFGFIGYFNALAQATSLTIDCQNPGWLAAYITPANVSSLNSLTVTGKINATDFATIGNLIQNYSLQHVDLGDVEIEEDNYSDNIFGVTNCNLQYLSTPKSYTRVGLRKYIQYFIIDTLVCGSNNSSPLRFKKNLYKEGINVKHLIIREGTTAFYLEHNATIESIEFPNSMTRLEGFWNVTALSKMNIPPMVEYLGMLIGPKLDIYGDTLYIPSTVKRFDDRWGAVRGYRNGGSSGGIDLNGTIKCVYLPEGLDSLYLAGMHYGAKVDIHIKAKTPPLIYNGSFNSNTIVYVPVGYKEVYKQTGIEGNQWSGATILEEVYAESITITSPEKLYVGDSQMLKVDFTPTNTTFKDITWTVSDSNCLSITQDGMCNALQYGIVDVTAINADHSCTETKTIKVYEHTTGITISEQEIKLKIGERRTIEAATLPLNTSDGGIIWSTTDDMIASIDESGTIRGVGSGTCTIIATSVDGGLTATCKLKVTQPVEAVQL